MDSPYSNEARPRVKRSSQLDWQKKSDQKKKVRRQPVVAPVPPVLHLVKLFAFLSKFLPFSLSTSKNVFSWFRLPQFIQKTFWENNFRTKSFFGQKKIIHFFFDFVFFELNSKLFAWPVSFNLIFYENQLFFNEHCTDVRFPRKKNFFFEKSKYFWGAQKISWKQNFFVFYHNFVCFVQNKFMALGSSLVWFPMKNNIFE